MNDYFNCCLLFALLLLKIVVNGIKISLKISETSYWQTVLEIYPGETSGGTKWAVLLCPFCVF